MELLLKLLLRTLAVGVTAYLLPGIDVTGVWPAVVTAIVLGLLNSVLRPILLILTLPINVLTLGLFTLVVNMIIVLIAAKLVPGFEVNGAGWALLFSIVLTVVNWFLEKVA